MSQGGGNEVARLHTTITGDVAPLVAATKQAEQNVKQTADKIEAITTATTQSVQQMGQGGPSAGFGIFGSNTFSPNSVATSSGGIINRITQGAKNAMTPVNALFSVLSRLGFVFSIVSAAAGGFYAALTAGERETKRSADALAELKKNLDGVYSSFKVNLEKSPSQVEAEALDEIEKKRAEQDAAAFARYKSGEMKVKDLAAFRVENEKQAEQAIANVRKNFDLAKANDEKNAQIAFNKSQEEAARTRAQTVAKMLGGEAEEYINSQIEIRKAQEIGDSDLRDARIEAIEQERDEKIRLMGEAAKKIADEEIEQAKRADREKRRIMQEFFRDARAAQAEGTMVESFFAGNQGQSFGLANRQRGAIEGQLPSINYMGAE